MAMHASDIRHYEESMLTSALVMGVVLEKGSDNDYRDAHELLNEVAEENGFTFGSHNHFLQKYQSEILHAVNFSKWEHGEKCLQVLDISHHFFGYKNTFPKMAKRIGNLRKEPFFDIVVLSVLFRLPIVTIMREGTGFSHWDTADMINDLVTLNKQPKFIKDDKIQHEPGQDRLILFYHKAGEACNPRNPKPNHFGQLFWVDEAHYPIYYGGNTWEGWAECGSLEPEDEGEDESE
jgi:hypothetical protein